MDLIQPAKDEQGKDLSTLINMRNSCYMNVCIQILEHTVPLRNLFTSKKYMETFPNTPENLKTKFVIDFYNLMNGMHEDDCIVQPISFMNSLTSCVRRFHGFRQHDAHECLIFILQLLHDGLANPVSVEINSKEPTRNPTLAWASLLKHEKSSNILSWFYGQYESMKKCLNCETVFPTYDPWNCLSLEIPLKEIQSEYTLDDLFKEHIEPEKLDAKYNCEKCKTPQEAMSQHVIWNCPPILSIQIKRFKANGGKIQVPIDFPFELDLRNYVSPNNQEQSTIYDLYGVIYHQGELNGGHYYMSCKVASDNQWHLFNDENQHLLNTYRIVTPFAYVLFYKKRFNESENMPPNWTWK